jgi:hypothetical protein
MMASTDPVTGETTYSAGTFGGPSKSNLPRNIQPGFNDPEQPFNLPPRTPPGFRPVTDPGYYKPSTATGFGQSLLGSGMAGVGLYRGMVGSGPVDPMMAMTNPYYRFTPAKPPVAATVRPLPPTPASPNVAGNVLSEMPGPVGPAQGQFPLGLGNGSQFQLPNEDINAGPGKGGMSPGQTYQPYTPAGSGFGGYGGYGGGMGGGKGGTQPRPASGGKGGAQYMGTPPSYNPYA